MCDVSCEWTAKNAMRVEAYQEQSVSHIIVQSGSVMDKLKQGLHKRLKDNITTPWAHAKLANLKATNQAEKLQHGYAAILAAARPMRSSMSGLKCRMRPCTGHAAASPSAQIV